MIGNLSKKQNKSAQDYSISDYNLPFSEYIARNRALIEKRRTDLQKTGLDANIIINANSPFELYPNTINKNSQSKFGALLIHGLLDSPLSLRDIGLRLQANGVLCRAILLPGHGTIPHDLLHVSYQEWIQAVRYGVETLRREVDHIFLIGYSTGAALSVHQALTDPQIAGIVLLAPAIKVKAPVDIVVAWHRLLKVFSSEQQWLYREEEIDYAKYHSIGFNAVTQVTELTKLLYKLKQAHTLSCPLFMAVSREDETISSHSAIDFFINLPNKENKLLLYTSVDHPYPDQRIVTRQTCCPELGIKHFSHVSIPFAPDNPHYGPNGDYVYASRAKTKNVIYGAYNRIEVNASDLLHKLNLLRKRRCELTFNPDFEFMSEMISNFILEHKLQKQTFSEEDKMSYSANWRTENSFES